MTTSALDMMRTMDKDAYAEYQKMGQNDDGGLSSLKYLTNWYAGAVKKDPSMVDTYEKQSEEYVEKNVKDRELDTTFADIKTESMAAFLESLKLFQSNHPNFLSSIINRYSNGEVCRVSISPISHRGRTEQASPVSGRSGNRGAGRKPIMHKR